MEKEETLTEYASRYTRMPKHLTADDGRKYRIAAWDTHTEFADGTVEIVTTLLPGEFRNASKSDGSSP